MFNICVNPVYKNIKYLICILVLYSIRSKIYINYLDTRGFNEKINRKAKECPKLD